jgi:hypothetical protein
VSVTMYAFRTLRARDMRRACLIEFNREMINRQGPEISVTKNCICCVQRAVRDAPKVDRLEAARVAQLAAAVEVAEDAHVVGAVVAQLLPAPVGRHAHRLAARRGLYLHAVVLAEQVEAEGVPRAEDLEPARLEDVGRLQQPARDGRLRQPQRLVEEGHVEAHPVERAERLGAIEGGDERRRELRMLAPEVALGGDAPELVRAPLARAEVLGAHDGDEAALAVQPRRLDVEREHARAVWAGASSSLFCRSLESAGETCGAKSAVCIKRRSGMPARGTYDEPDRRNQYLTWQSGLTKDGLLTAFYMPVLELARLMQATAVPQLVIPDIIAFTISGITDIIAISNISTYTISRCY